MTITKADYNNFTSDILYAKIKRRELLNKSDIFDQVKNSDFNAKLATLALKAEQDENAKLQTHELSYFLVYFIF